jgi:hypothetical protein
MVYQDGRKKWKTESLKDQALSLAPKIVNLCL